MKFFKFLLPVLMLSSLFGASGSTLYKQKCKSCHGNKAEKKAMGKSKVIAGMPVSHVKKSMQDYASGKRKAMSFVIKIKQNFLKHRSKKELHDLATHIHSL